jgi:hypothetical protein
MKTHYQKIRDELHMILTSSETKTQEHFDRCNDLLWGENGISSPNQFIIYDFLGMKNGFSRRYYAHPIITNASGEGLVGKTPLHFAVNILTSPEYLEFWNKMAEYHNLWEIQMSDASGKRNAGKTPLHDAASRLTSPEYSDFWEKMATYHDLWKIQMTYASSDEYVGKTPLHYAMSYLNLPKYLNFWMKMAEYQDLWKIQMPINSVIAGKTPLHYAAEYNLTSPEYLEFWKKMAEYPDLWKMQIPDSNKYYAGQTPLHFVAQRLTSSVYLEFWNKMTEYPDLWKIQMSDASGKRYAGKTPLHFSTFLISPEYLSFWEKMAKYPDLWKIQMTDASGEGYAGQTPLHSVVYYLTSPDFLPFWKKMEEYPDLWKIQMTDASGSGYAGKTPLHDAAGRLTSPEYSDFWNRIIKYMDINNKYNIQLGHNGEKSMFEKLFGVINRKKYDVDYFIRAHGSLTGTFFKLHSNITVLFITKSFEYSHVVSTNTYLSENKYDLNTTLNMCDKVNILRTYKPNDLVPNLILEFFERVEPFSVKGIYDRQNYNKTLDEYFSEDIPFDNNYLFKEKRDVIDNLGIFKSQKDKKNITSNLCEIVKYMSEKHRDKNITLVVGSCRISHDFDFNYDKLCKYVQLIDRSNMPITRYDNLCRENTKIISKKDPNTHEVPFNLERQSSFATFPTFATKEVFHNFDKDIEYALRYSNNVNIRETKRKLSSYEEISFTDIIDVYKYIIENQETKIPLPKSHNYKNY